jgi:CHRD domain/PEP-CTERM motif
MRLANVLRGAAAALALTVAAAPAGATIVDLIATLNGAQETPPVATAATGTANMTYNDVTNLLSWTISFQDLVGTTTDAHFHGPAPVGVPAGVQVPIPHTDGLTADTLIGSAIISELQEAQLLAQLWYINIHSTFAPGGEIRGQVIPEPGTLLLAGLGLIALAAKRRLRHS